MRILASPLEMRTMPQNRAESSHRRAGLSHGSSPALSSCKRSHHACFGIIRNICDVAANCHTHDGHVITPKMHPPSSRASPRRSAISRCYLPSSPSHSPPLGPLRCIRPRLIACILTAACSSSFLCLRACWPRRVACTRFAASFCSCFSLRCMRPF